MTLPKGYGPSGRRAEGAGPRDEIERMIGRRVEHMNGIYIMGFILCWVATAGGIYVGDVRPKRGNANFKEKPYSIKIINRKVKNGLIPAISGG